MKKYHKINILSQSIGLIVLTSGLLCNSAYALQAIEDEHLENVTGEGIGFILDNFSLRWNGVDDTAGTGYARLIPVEPLSDLITTHNDATANATGTAVQKKRAAYDVDIGKADVFVYGLAISKSDNNANSQFSGQNVSVGTAENPWLFKTKTDQIPNFAGTSKSLTYLGIEAPLFTNLLNSSGSLISTDPNGYDLKFGLWADAFVRDPNVVDGATGEFALNGATRLTTTGASCTIGAANCVQRENRLRLQAIINGISLNGTNIQIFQTLDGAGTADGLGTAYNHYNNTLGLGATLRINSGDARGSGSKLAIATAGTVTKYKAETNRYSTIYLGQASGATNHLSKEVASQYRLRTVDTTYAYSGATWTLPSDFESHVMRLSTREESTSYKANDLLYSPAIETGTTKTMPTFANTEGLYLYKPNINLVLGSTWQPLILGVAPDGKNFSLEVTRIPDTPEVYKEIYAVYPDATGDLTPAEQAEYKGGTCSIYWCGGDGNGYAKNATHSSITIGSTEYTAPVNTGTDKRPVAISAYKGADAVGVSFGKLQTTSAASTEYYYQLQAQQRQVTSNGSSWECIQSNGAWGQPTANCSGGVTDGCNYNNFATKAAWLDIAMFHQPCIANTAISSLPSGCTPTANANFPTGSTANQNTSRGNYNTGIMNTLRGIQIRASNTNIANEGSVALVNLGYAPNATHNAYTVGNGLGKMGWNQNNANNGTWDYGYRTDVAITSGYRWTVPTWGGMTAASGTSPNGAGVDSESIIIQNIRNMYAASAANNGGTALYDDSTKRWDSRSDINSRFTDLNPTMTTVNTGITGMTMQKGTQTFSASPLNNLGSAVIDGMLIQHMKISTKGL